MAFPYAGKTDCLGEPTGLQGHLGEPSLFETSAVMGLSVGSQRYLLGRAAGPLCKAVEAHCMGRVVAEQQPGFWIQCRCKKVPSVGEKSLHLPPGRGLSVSSPTRDRCMKGDRWKPAPLTNLYNQGGLSVVAMLSNVILFRLLIKISIVKYPKALNWWTEQQISLLTCKNIVLGSFSYWHKQ